MAKRGRQGVEAKPETLKLITACNSAIGRYVTPGLFRPLLSRRRQLNMHDCRFVRVVAASLDPLDLEFELSLYPVRHQ
jgi:hypothetical protein